VGQVSWKAASDGRYWIDVLVGQLGLRVMVDLGLVDPLNRVAFEVEPVVYDLLEQRGQLSHFRRRLSRSSTGSQRMTYCGETTACLVDPLHHQAAGPVTRLYVSRGVIGMPNRVGTVFFHSLAACQVIWDLSGRTWCVNYP